jgi:dephospho-CoA kinase
MLKIGLTGGIGTGKTTVATIFKVLGIPVFDADTVAKELMEKNLVLREQLIQHFGTPVFENGKLNRKWLANIVFKDPYELNILNAMVHPLTLKAASDWFLAQDAVYAIKEAALLFEAGAGSDVDYVIGVFAPQELRIQRVMQRDGLNRNEVLERMDRQVSDSIKMKLCDFVIVNDDQVLLTQQVLDVHKKIISI